MTGLFGGVSLQKAGSFFVAEGVGVDFLSKFWESLIDRIGCNRAVCYIQNLLATGKAKESDLTDFAIARAVEMRCYF